MAGVDIGTAYLTVAPSAKGFAGKLQSELGGGFASAGAKAGDQASKGFGGRFKAGMATAARAGALALVGAMAVGVKAAAGAVNAASELQQSTGGVEAIFGKNAAGIKASAEAAAQGLGLSKNSYQELAAVLGAGLKNKGITDYAKQSQDLIKIGADLSAQFGGSTKDAVEALSSALRGESDPIERYGVALNETAVNAQAAAMGLKKGANGYTEQQKSLARLAIIQKQTADAQGTFGRESDTLAGQQQRLKATYENIQATLGAKLLPVTTKAATAVNKFIGEMQDGTGKGGQFVAFLKDAGSALSTVAGFISRNSDVLFPLVGAILAGVAAFKLVTTVVKAYTAVQAALNVVLSLNPIGIVIIAVAALVAGIVIAYKKSETFRKIVKGAFDAIGAAATFMWNKVVAPVIRFLIGAFISVTEFYATLLRGLSKIPGFGWAKGAADKLQTVADKAAGIKNNIRDIPSSKKVTVTVSYQEVGGTRLVGGKLKVDKRATGGPVRAGQPYVVGEKRPELFVPDRNGTILPSVPGSGVGGPGKQLTIQGNVGYDPDEIFRRWDKAERLDAALHPVFGG